MAMKLMEIRRRVSALTTAFPQSDENKAGHELLSQLRQDLFAEAQAKGREPSSMSTKSDQRCWPRRPG
jgi:hypothetical protein